MKSIAMTLVALAVAATLNAAAAESSWSTDFPAAQALAKKENKLVVMNFTGSDWCWWRSIFRPARSRLTR